MAKAKKTKTEKKIAEHKKPNDMSFKILAGYIKDICKIVRTTRNKALFTFDKHSGLTVTFVSEDSTTAGTILLSNKAFREIKMNKKEIVFGLKIKYLESIIKLADQYEAIEFMLTGTRMEVNVKHLHRSFETIYEDDTPSFKADDVKTDHKVVFDIESADIKQAIKHSQLVGNQITIKGSEHLLIIEGGIVTDDTVEARYLSKEAQEQTGLKSFTKNPKTVDSIFNIEIIKPVIEVSKKELKIHLGESMPVAIEWYPQDYMATTFFIAPYVAVE